MLLDALDFDNTDDWSHNWRAIDAFVRSWLATEFRRDIEAPEIAALEAESGGALPPTAKEWFALILAARSLPGFSWRDCLAATPVPGHPATSLLLQGESDFYWAVADSDRGRPDPPVHAYMLDFDSIDGEFLHVGEWAPTVTSFALDYFLSYLQSPGGGFQVELSETDLSAATLESELGKPYQLGHLQLHIQDGVLVTLGARPPSWRHGMLVVELQEGQNVSGLPPSLGGLVQKANAVHGAFSRALGPVQG